MKQKPSWNALLARGFDFREDSNTKIYNVLHHIIIEEMIENMLRHNLALRSFLIPNIRYQVTSKDVT